MLDELAGDEDYRARDNGYRADCGGRCRLRRQMLVFSRIKRNAMCERAALCFELSPKFRTRVA